MGIQSLGSDDLTSLVCELLTAEHAGVLSAQGVEESQADVLLLQEQGGGQRLIQAHRSLGTPLGGLSLPGIAARAMSVGVSHASVFLSGVLDAERQTALGPLLMKVRSGTGVSVELIDAQELLTRLVAQPPVAARYFPTETDAEEAAERQDIPRALVRIAYAVAPKPSDAPSPSVRRERLRLSWTAGGVLLLIWLPVKLDPGQARLVGGVGLGVILLAVLVAQVATSTGDRRARPPDSVMDALLPIKDELAVGRSVTMARLGSGPTGITVDILKQLPSVLLRASTKTALLLLLVGCSCAYLLLWGVDSGACATTAHCAHAFVGPADRASAGDFMNLAVGAAFFNPPSNIQPASRFARALVGAEFVLSAVLLGSYAAFFGFGGRLRSRDGDS